MNKNNQRKNGSNDIQKGLRDESGRFTPKGAKVFGKEGGESSSGSRNDNRRNNKRGGPQQGNRGNRNR